MPTASPTQASDAGWSHEHYLAAVLDREVSARDSSGSELGSGRPGFPPRKTIEDYVFDHQPALKRDTILTWPAGHFLAGGQNVVSARTARHRENAFRDRARDQSRPRWGTVSCSAPRPNGSPDCKPHHTVGKLRAELAKLRRYGLIIVDEVGYIPFEQDAANLFFQLVSSRYEHASLILTANLPFARWGRRLLRPNRRRGDDRPHRPPRRGRHPEGLQLSTPEHRDRDATLRPRRKRGKLTTHNCSDLKERN